MLKTRSTLQDMVSREQRFVAKGTTLKSEGDDSPVRFYVVEGWLAVSKSLGDGERQIVEFILPGETCDPTAADDRTSFVHIEALCDVVVVTIDRTAWSRFLRHEPDLQRSQRLRDFAAQARQSERMLRLGKSSAESRIAYALIELCLRLCSVRGKCDCAFHVPLGQQELAEFTGLSSVHVCRTLRRLNRLGLITTGDHMDIVIHDLPALADLAGVDLAALRDEIIPGAA